MPIICPTKRRGASFVMALKPTGLSASSPIVWNRYVNTSQVGQTCCARGDQRRGADHDGEAQPQAGSGRTRTSRAPTGSRCRRASQIQSIE